MSKVSNENGVNILYLKFKFKGVIYFRHLLNVFTNSKAEEISVTCPCSTKEFLTNAKCFQISVT